MCVFPKGWQNNSRNCKIPVWVLSIVQWFYPFPQANSMQQTPQMHSNTSPTSFECSGTTTHKTKTQNLNKQLKTCPEKTTRFIHGIIDLGAHLEILLLFIMLLFFQAGPCVPAMSAAPAPTPHPRCTQSCPNCKRRRGRRR